MENKELSTALITIAPAIVMPLLLWFLNKREKGGKEIKINEFIKRLELLEKLKGISERIAGPTPLHLETLIEQELVNIQAYLTPKYSQKEEETISNFENLSKFRRAFLLFIPAAGKVTFLQVLFFYLLFATILSPITIAVAVSEGESAGAYFLVFIFYVGILVVLSRFTNRVQKNRLKKTL